jgi:thiosulfate/3-mercaptopyruvate sulfurtransferase
MNSRRVLRIPLLLVFAVLGAVPLLIGRAWPQTSPEPWTAAQTVQPADLAKELAGKSAPTVLFVGFDRLYGAGRIKDAQFHGMGSNAEGLAEIRKWAEPLPRSTNLVIYCGCCPLGKCPNIRPAFALLHDMGFTKFRVLILPTSFAVDWVGQGLPFDHGR